VKFSARKLTDHLAHQLAPVYVVTGDEPLLVSEALKEIRVRARQDGFEQREHYVIERTFKWQELEASANNLSLFSNRRVIELRLPTPRPGDLGSRTLRALVERSDPDLILLIATTKLDAAAAKSVWIRCIEKHGVVVQVWPIDRPELPRWIAQRAATAGLNLTASAAELLADRVEGNLLAADQEIQKLVMSLGEGTADELAVLEEVASNARFDVFRLADAILSGDAGRAMRVLDGLRVEGIAPALVSWAISRDLCLLARLKVAALIGESEASSLNRPEFRRQRQPLVRNALRRFELDQLTSLLVQASEVDNVVKGTLRGNPWDELIRLVMVMLDPGSLKIQRSPWRVF